MHVQKKNNISAQTMDEKGDQNPIEWRTLNNLNIDSMDSLHNMRINELHVLNSENTIDEGLGPVQAVERDSLAVMASTEISQYGGETLKEQMDGAYTKSRLSFDNFAKVSQMQHLHPLNASQERRAISKDVRNNNSDAINPME